jgi:urease accessory protein
MPADGFVFYVCEVQIMRNVMVLGSVVGAASLVLLGTPVLAHHPMGGAMPSTLLEGLLSGLAHPVIGPDHLAFIVAIGLLAAVRRQVWLLPVFLLAAMLGTVVHVARVDLPGVELLLAGSIVLFGALLAGRQRWSAGAIVALAVLAGLFHGYAYGEAIVGAEATPLLAYLVGFTAIQLGIAGGAFLLGDRLKGEATALRSAGLVIAGMGGAFLANHLLAIVLP